LCLPENGRTIGSVLLACKPARAAAVWIAAALWFVPVVARADVVRVGIVWVRETPEILRLRVENVLATHHRYELAGARRVDHAPRRATLRDATRQLEAPLLLVLDPRSIRLWDATRGRFEGALGADASRTAMRRLLAASEDRRRAGGVPTWVSVAVVGAAAAAFVAFVLVRATAADEEPGLGLRVYSP